MHDLYEFREGLEPSQSLLPCPLRSYLDPVKGKEAKGPLLQSHWGSGPKLLAIVTSGSYRDQSGHE
jgi:hypothetical protein